MDNLFIWWIVIFVIVCIAEAISQQLVAIWFAAGSLVCVFLSYFGVDLSTQLIMFIAISVVTMALLRPYAMGKLKPEIVKTNAEELIGKMGVAMNEFDSHTNEGRIFIDGIDWAAKSMSSKTIKKGQEVVITKIEGVKLFVEAKEDK